MEEKKLTPEQREKAREDQLSILKSESLKNLYVAAQGRNGRFGEKFGKEAEHLTQQYNYMKGLSGNDSKIGSFLSDAYRANALEAMKTGANPYDTGGVTPPKLLDYAKGVYESAINSIKVKDVLELTGIENVHDKQISEEEKEMYMDKFAEKNEKYYSILTNMYFENTFKSGFAEAINASVENSKKGLEAILSQDPDKHKQEKEE